MLDKYNPEVWVIWEAWQNYKINWYNQDYDINQTEFAPYQGVWIILRGYLGKYNHNFSYFEIVDYIILYSLVQRLSIQIIHLLNQSAKLAFFIFNKSLLFLFKIVFYLKYEFILLKMYY